MSELSDKLASKKDLPRHLRELGLLLGRPVRKDELLSLEQTKEIRARANQVARHPVVKFEVPFDAKREPRFAAFVQRLAQANPNAVYLWTATSNTCGLLQPLPLELVRMEFPFDVNPEGIIVILTCDLQDQLLLDYSTGENNQQLLEVEASGEHWGGVPY